MGIEGEVRRFESGENLSNVGFPDDVRGSSSFERIGRLDEMAAVRISRNPITKQGGGQFGSMWASDGN
jgi:hypothetical protein